MFSPSLPQDSEFMQIALNLAQKGQFTTTPNPCVGCVLVKNNQIIATGFHQKAGQPHAEVMALRQAGEQAKGATAYVTLEPCSHFGRTPPCAKGLIEAGVVRVVIALQDPNPKVAGAGIAMLKQAGIEVSVGVLSQAARQINLGFLKRMEQQRPFVQLKMAMSIDGKTAMANGESKWITGEASRADVQLQRAKACAILSTSATVLADDPLLNVRWQQLPPSIQGDYLQEDVRQPIRIILDNHHQILPHHRIFQQSSPIWLVSQKPRSMENFPSFCQHLQLPLVEDYLPSLMQKLAQKEINLLWIEAGAKLGGALIEANLVDQLIVYVAPKLLGSDGKGLCHLPHIQHLAQAPTWQLIQVEQFDNDVKLVYQQ